FFRVVLVPSPLDSRISLTELTLPVPKPCRTGCPARVALVVGRFEDSQAANTTMTILLTRRMPTRREVMAGLLLQRRYAFVCAPGRRSGPPGRRGWAGPGCRGP